MPRPPLPASQRASARPARRSPPPALAADSLARVLMISAEAVAGVRAGHSLNDGLDGLWQRHPDLDAGQRGAVMDLTYGTLRDFGRGELMLRRLLHTPLTEAQTDALLRVALHRLEVRPEQAHTIVDQAVHAAAHMAGGGLKGLVNGVLRNALRQRDTLAATLRKDDEAHWRHPRWWVERVRRDHPRSWEDILAAGNAHPPMSLRVNRRRTTREAVAAALAEAGHETAAFGDWGLRLLRPAPVASLPGFAEGLYSVQDAGAQEAVAWLDVREGMTVLDACAAPGGKTAAILEGADCAVTALDADAPRARRIAATLERLGLTARTAVADARQADTVLGEARFDRILADVPCSASGVARRHPDIKWLRRPDDIGSFATVQGEILEALWPRLKPGGRMLYVTCSLFAEENSLQVSRFAARHADCMRVPLADQLERTLLPNAEHDGFFFALLEKAA